MVCSTIFIFGVVGSKEVMQVTSQALVRWRLIHFGRKEEVLRNTYLIILLVSLLLFMVL